MTHRSFIGISDWHGNPVAIYSRMTPSEKISAEADACKKRTLTSSLGVSSWNFCPLAPALKRFNLSKYEVMSGGRWSIRSGMQILSDSSILMSYAKPRKPIFLICFCDLVKAMMMFSARIFPCMAPISVMAFSKLQIWLIRKAKLARANDS